MPKITVAMRKTRETSITVDATDEQLEQLRNGENPFWDRLEHNLEQNIDTETETDYAVLDGGGDRYIVEWSD